MVPEVFRISEICNLGGDLGLLRMEIQWTPYGIPGFVTGEEPDFKNCDPFVTVCDQFVTSL